MTEQEKRNEITALKRQIIELQIKAGHDVFSATLRMLRDSGTDELVIKAKAIYHELSQKYLRRRESLMYKIALLELNGNKIKAPGIGRKKLHDETVHQE